MPNPLSERICVPCQGGVPPLTPEQAREYLPDIPGWSLSGDATRIERAFEFRDFVESLDFINRIGALAEAEGHHPDIEFGWGYARVTLYTHKIKGLHENDFIMAAKISALQSD